MDSLIISTPTFLKTSSLLAAGKRKLAEIWRLVFCIPFLQTSVSNNYNVLDKKTGVPTFHIDIKSVALQDMLKKILREVKAICLQGDKLTVCLLAGVAFYECLGADDWYHKGKYV
jgi:hypothetical protein